MDIDNCLKEKIIDNKYINNDELMTFINYIINKSNTITNHMISNNSYSRINLCNEILWSYNLDSNIYKENDRYYLIFDINNSKYLLDIDFNDNRIKYLKENKYIKLDNNIYINYLNIIGG